MKRLALTVVALALLTPSGAQAATLVNAGGTLVYTGSAAKSDVSFTGGTTVVVRSNQGLSDNDPISAAGCSGPVVSGRLETYTCESVNSIAVDAGEGDDSVSGYQLTLPMSIAGGAGDDVLSGGDAADALAGDGGDDQLIGNGGGADSLSGGPGEDRLTAGAGDRVSGGTGIDVAIYAEQAALARAISLDGVADDGVAGDAANFLADVEDVDGSSPPRFLYDDLGGDDPTATSDNYGPITISGSAVANQLTGGDGNDAIVGGAGADTLTGNAGDDTLNARDGFTDRVSCGPGVDTAIVDPYDAVSDNCESVEGAAVGFGLEDKPPTIAWRLPADAARLSPSGATTLEVTAADDLRVQSVRFLDDARAICTVAVAPFTCAYQPRPDDVGRNTLVAVVTDSAGQTTTITRAVSVDKFKPQSVSLRAKRTGTRWVVTGKVTLPKGPRCSGTVTVAARRGTKGVWKRSDRLGKGCTYRVTLTVPGKGKPRFTALYGGSDQVATSRPRAL